MAKKRTWFLLALLFAGWRCICQNGELGKFDCTYAKEILVPFNYSADTAVKAKPLYNQKVFYSFRDQFTYWYKVVVKRDEQLSFKVKALNDSDAYSVMVYNYNGDGFCEKVYYRKIAPVASAFFIGKGAGVSITNAGTFNAKKNNVYYVGVLNTSLNNCGHRFTICYKKDTVNIDAIHLPCKTDAASLNPSLAKQPEKMTPVVLAKKDTLIPIPVKTESIIVKDNLNSVYQINFVTLNAVNKTPVEARVGLYDKLSGNAVPLTETGKGEFTGNIEKDKTYTIKTNAFGYQPREISLDANTLILAMKYREEILLDPLKQGQNLVLKSIYFVPNTYALRKESMEELEKLLNFLKNNETTVIEIQGHTNGDNKIEKTPAYVSLGEEWNFSGSSRKLSQKRAEVIKNYLVDHGISETRLVAKGYGGQKYLIKSPETNSEAQQNIRVEISVLKN